MSHYLDKCKHGVVVRQCRCGGPKTVNVVPCPPMCPSEPTYPCDQCGKPRENVTPEISQRFFRRVKARIDADREKIAALEAQVRELQQIRDSIQARLDRELAIIYSDDGAGGDGYRLATEHRKMRKALEMISRSTPMDMEAVLVAREALS